VKLTTHLHLVKSKNEWSYTSTPQYASLEWCSVKKHRDNFTNVIPLDFNAPVPAINKFLNSVREESFLVASLTNFEPRQFLEGIVIADEI